MPNWTELLNESPMILNHFKGKIERTRQAKRDKGMIDELTQEDLEPILENALNMVKSNVPPSKMRPDNISELSMMLKKSGVARDFGLRASEVDTMTQMAMEKLGMQQPIQAPMPQPQGIPQGLPPELRQMLMNQRPQTGGMR